MKLSAIYTLYMSKCTSATMWTYYYWWIGAHNYDYLDCVVFFFERNI